MTQKLRDITGLQLALSEAVTMLELLRKDVSVLNLLAKLKQDLIDCFKFGGKVLIFGNGGFAAISQHISAELVGRLKLKRKPLSAISLSSDVAVLTCEANDFGFEKVFSRQIEAIARPHDIALGLTTSGKSKNILEAISSANDLGISSYVITGQNPPPSLKELCDNIIQIPSSHTGSIQDVTMILFHRICEEIEKEVCTESTGETWQKVLEMAKEGHFKWLILDRDGVVNELIPNGYAISIEDIKLNDQFLEVCKDLTSLFRGIFIVTNQACIGKGLATQKQIDDVNDYIDSEISKRGGKITAIYVCPDANSESVNRKPNIGMAVQIKQQYPEVEFSETIVVGDSYSDALFAKRIGASFIKINNA